MITNLCLVAGRRMTDENRILNICQLQTRSDFRQLALTEIRGQNLGKSGFIYVVSELDQELQRSVSTERSNPLPAQMTSTPAKHDNRFCNMNIMNASIQQYYNKQILYLNIKALCCTKILMRHIENPTTRERTTQTHSVTSRITPSLPLTFY